MAAQLLGAAAAVGGHFFAADAVGQQGEAGLDAAAEMARGDGGRLGQVVQAETDVGDVAVVEGAPRFQPGVVMGEVGGDGGGRFLSGEGSGGCFRPAGHAAGSLQLDAGDLVDPVVQADLSFGRRLAAQFAQDVQFQQVVGGRLGALPGSEGFFEQGCGYCINVHDLSTDARGKCVCFMSVFCLKGVAGKNATKVYCFYAGGAIREAKCAGSWVDLGNGFLGMFASGKPFLLDFLARLMVGGVRPFKRGDLS